MPNRMPVDRGHSSKVILTIIVYRWELQFGQIGACQCISRAPLAPLALALLTPPASASSGASRASRASEASRASGVE